MDVTNPDGEYSARLQCALLLTEPNSVPRRSALGTEVATYRNFKDPFARRNGGVAVGSGGGFRKPALGPVMAGMGRGAVPVESNSLTQRAVSPFLFALPHNKQMAHLL